MEINDQTMMLQRLLKYPPVESLYPIINQAFQFKSQIQKIEDEIKLKQEEKKIQKDKLPKKEILLFNNHLETPTLIYTKRNKNDKNGDENFKKI